MVIEAKVKKWGNSLAIILPKEIVERKQIHEEDSLLVFDVVKDIDISESFGALKGKFKHTAQELKDMAREGWD
jgi:antitoxin component of MazEF toxin-antitoxin module